MDLHAVETRILDPRLYEWGLPRYESDMAAGIDLRACIVAPLALVPQAPPILVSSGLAVHIADPHLVGIVVPRSGLGHRSGVVLGNTCGIIDADYLGPIQISLYCRNEAGSEPVIIAPGDRVAQLLFMPIARPFLQIVQEFSKQTARGEGGFGSTGVAVPTSTCHRVTQYP
jgi:dUTP pyrophosphatase